MTGEIMGKVTCQRRREGGGAVDFGGFIKFARHVLESGEKNHDRVPNSPKGHERQGGERPTGASKPVRAGDADDREHPADEALVAVEQPHPDHGGSDDGHEGGQEDDGAEERLSGDSHIEKQRETERYRESRGQGDGGIEAGDAEGFPENGVVEDFPIIRQSDEQRGTLFGKRPVAQRIIKRQRDRQKQKQREPQHPRGKQQLMPLRNCLPAGGGHGLSMPLDGQGLILRVADAELIEHGLQPALRLIERGLGILLELRDALGDGVQLIGHHWPDGDGRKGLGIGAGCEPVENVDVGVGVVLIPGAGVMRERRILAMQAAQFFHDVQAVDVGDEFERFFGVGGATRDGEIIGGAPGDALVDEIVGICEVIGKHGGKRRHRPLAIVGALGGRFSLVPGKRVLPCVHGGIEMGDVIGHPRTLKNHRHAASGEGIFRGGIEVQGAGVNWLRDCGPRRSENPRIQSMAAMLAGPLTVSRPVCSS